MSIMESYHALKAQQDARRKVIADMTAEADRTDELLAGMGDALAPLGALFTPPTPAKASSGRTGKPRTPESIAQAKATREANKAAKAAAGSEGAEKKPRDYAKEVEQRRLRKAAKAAEAALA